MSAPNNLVKEFESKLIGKTISSSSSESSTEFPQSKLPAKHRIVRPGALLTRDFHEDRLNVFVDEKGKVTHLTQG